MINYFKQLFYKKTVSDTTVSKNKIIFEVDNNQKIDIKFELNDLSVEAATKFGYLLFLINEGYYVQSALDILSNMAKEDLNKQRFAQQTINQWSSKILDNETINDQPIIKPTQFNNVKQ